MTPELVQSSAPRPLANYSEAFKVGNLVFAAGQLASDFETGVPPEASINRAFPFYGSEIKQQTRYILDNLRVTFEAAGSSLANVVKAQVFMTDMNDFNAFDEVWKEYFGDNLPARTTVGNTELLGAGPAQLQTRYILENFKKTFAAADSSLANVVKAQVFLRNLHDFNAFDEVWKEFFAGSPPPRTTVGVTELLGSGPEQLLEIDLIAHTNDTSKQVVQSDAPRPLAVYSEAVVVDGLVFAAGQLASDFKTGVPEGARANPAFPYYGSNIKAQTRFILANCRTTFEAAGSSLDSVFKAQVFMTDMRNFNGFDEVWKEHFKTPPARTTVGTTGLLVKHTLVEIDLIGSVD